MNAWQRRTASIAARTAGAHAPHYPSPASVGIRSVPPGKLWGPRNNAWSRCATAGDESTFFSLMEGFLSFRSLPDFQRAETSGKIASVGAPRTTGPQRHSVCLAGSPSRSTYFACWPDVSSRNRLRDDTEGGQVRYDFSAALRDNAKQTVPVARVYCWVTRYLTGSPIQQVLKLLGRGSRQ